MPVQGRHGRSHRSLADAIPVAPTLDLPGGRHGSLTPLKRDASS